MGKFEVTQKQWVAVMHHNLSAHKGENLPAENVSWQDATEFCKRLSLMTGRRYRLPSEAEWEYACRAGSTTSYSFGNQITTELANYWDIDSVEPLSIETSSQNVSEEAVIELKTVPVGNFYPNAFGLYDMHGNVYELCQDRFHDDYTGAPCDGSAWGQVTRNTDLVVIRGGSCDYYADNCRSAFRSETEAAYRYSGTGFRVACSMLSNDAV